MPALSKPLMGREALKMSWRYALAEYIRNLRTDAGLTQEELCLLTGLDNKQTISAIETGRTSVPDERLEVFAEALNVPVAEFVKQVLRYQNPWAFVGGVACLPRAGAEQVGSGLLGLPRRVPSAQPKHAEPS